MSSYRVMIVLNGNRDAVARSVRRMLDNHGFTEVGFEMNSEITDPLAYEVPEVDQAQQANWPCEVCGKDGNPYQHTFCPEHNPLAVR
jgi:hypothetical protein